MKLSVPLYVLKHQAKSVSRAEKIPLHAALNRIAVGQGFASWNLLMAQRPAESHAARLYAELRAGDLLLIGARPGHGKTLMSLELAVEAMRAGHEARFFSLEYTESDCLGRFETIGVSFEPFRERFRFDGSDEICAEYIVQRLEGCAPGTLVVVDYLQLLDQRRGTPELGEQVRQLKAFAVARRLTMVFISQIDRSYDPATKPWPDLSDVRLPNPLDLSLFDLVCFLRDGKVRYQRIG